jgi:cytochrome b561
MPAYTRTAITLHWLVALLILAAFPLGLVMHELALSPMKLKLYSWHKWLGVTVFLFAVIRLLWRATHTPPPEPVGMPAWQVLAARLAHGALYALILLIPLTGWLMSSAKGFQTVYLGVLPLPDLLAKSESLGELLEEVHEQLNHLLLILVIVHTAAAVKHHRVDKDDVLARMAPWIKR